MKLKKLIYSTTTVYSQLILISTATGGAAGLFTGMVRANRTFDIGVDACPTIDAAAKLKAGLKNAGRDINNCVALGARGGSKFFTYPIERAASMMLTSPQKKFKINS